MMKRSIPGILFAFFTLSSCISFGDGYSHMSRRLRERVVHYDGKIADISDNSHIYTVKVEQVKEFLASHEKVIIYDYTPYCTSDFCMSPMALADMCRAKGVDLLVISNIYDDIYRGMNKEFPILMIETKEYKTKLRSKYIDQFYYSLTGHNQKEMDYAGYYYFDKGNFVKGIKNPKDIEKI